MVMTYLHNSKNPKTKVSAIHGYYCDRPDHIFVWRNLDLVLWVWKEAECLKCYLIDHMGREMEASGAEYDLVNCGNQEVSKEKNGS